MRKIITLTIVLTLIIISFGFYINKNPANYLVGDYFRGSVNVGSEFHLDSMFNFSYYNWCDICPGIYIYGKWRVNDSLLILHDTLIVELNPHHAYVRDTIRKETSRFDTLIIRKVNDEIYLCHKDIHEKLINYYKEQNIDYREFVCYKKEK